MLWFHDLALPADVAGQLGAWGVPVVRDACIILGVPVGRDENKMRQLVTAIVDESTESIRGTPARSSSSASCTIGSACRRPCCSCV